jgi:hypothetical protein
MDVIIGEGFTRDEEQGICSKLKISESDELVLCIVIAEFEVWTNLKFVGKW